MSLVCWERESVRADDDAGGDGDEATEQQKCSSAGVCVCLRDSSGVSTANSAAAVTPSRHVGSCDGGGGGEMMAALRGETRSTRTNKTASRRRKPNPPTGSMDDGQAVQNGETDEGGEEEAHGRGWTDLQDPTAAILLPSIISINQHLSVSPSNLGSRASRARSRPCN